MGDLFKYIKAHNFFPKYAPDVKNYARKILGTNSKGKKICFTDQDEADIVKGVESILKKLKQSP